MSQFEMADNSEAVAIIGMAGRFPRAASLAAFWERLAAGEECISFFTEEEMKEAGVSAELLRNPALVPAAGILEGIDLFDHEFFGLTPREAEITDPQQRFFLECAWEALEDAGYDLSSFRGSIGVFASASFSNYLKELLGHPELLRMMGSRVALGNDEDFLPSWVSYKLDLRGPSLNVQSACSSSLVAVHLACQSLLNAECEMAIAGGVSISTLRKAGHLYQEGGVDSPDGHCRAFDAQAQGSVSGDGVGIVVLKPLDQALADGDSVRAVIRGSAVNNDGARKIGYTAPSVEGQARVITEALAVSGVAPDEIGYVEAHGTGTPLGDPIEFEALCQAFKTESKGFCALSSVKTNIGHLDAAAGVAGLIKAVLALGQHALPANLHFKQPNPKIRLQDSPFYVNSELKPWPTGDSPRRAGVSSFGIGGTNAHVVLEESPPPPAEESKRQWRLVVLSGRTPQALDSAAAKLAKQLRAHPELSLRDVAYTCQVGRRRFAQRRMLVASSLEEAAQRLESRDEVRDFDASELSKPPQIAFLFPGQGSQYVAMGQGLYADEPAFRQALDRCADLLKPSLGLDLREALFSSDGAEHDLNQTALAQPALFAIEYALCELWQAWGITPAAMAGHSIGEYVAACRAGVFSLEDALHLVAARGRLMQQAPTGAMLSVPLAEDELGSLLEQGCCLAALNGPNRSVISGSAQAIEQAQRQLKAQGIESRRLHTSHAFHSALMDPVMQPFGQELRTVRLHKPRIPFLSNLSGSWIKDEEATDPDYWVEHLRRPVRFSDQLNELFKVPNRLLLEAGPANTLSSLALRHPGKSKGHVILNSMRHPQDPAPDQAAFLLCAGRLWMACASLDWQAAYSGERPRRIPLPTYPFERKRHWVSASTAAPSAAKSSLARQDFEDWFYLPSWKRSTPPTAFQPSSLSGVKGCCLIFEDQGGVGRQAAELLGGEGFEVVRVAPGSEFARQDGQSFSLAPGQAQGHRQLLETLQQAGKRPQTVLHLWGLDAAGQCLDECLQRGFYSLVGLGQAFASLPGADPVFWLVANEGVQQVTGLETLCPEKALALGPCRVIPQELANIRCRNVDFDLPDRESPQQMAERLVGELTIESTASAVAWRGPHRWVQEFQRAERITNGASHTHLQQEGVYLITGGLGRLGLALAELLAREFKARLALTRLSSFPARSDWQAFLESKGQDDPRSPIIEKLQQLEEAGARIETFSADVADRGQMERVVEAVEQRWGPLQGVFHAAGRIGPSAMCNLQELDDAHCRAQFRSKVEGTLVIGELLRQRPEAFCVLTSSLASVLGGLGFTAYAAANSFLDAFAQQQAASGKGRWMSVNWDGWHFSDTEPPGETALTAKDGLRAFKQLLSMSQASQVAVSTSDLSSRLARWVEGRAPQRQPQTQADSQKPDSEAGLEESVIQIWQELLGIETIDPSDSFFELGGDSLLATQVFSRLRDRLQLNLPLRLLFEAPTAAGFARKIAEQQGQVGEFAIPPLTHADRSRRLPPSFAQQRLWFIDQMETTSAAYNMMTARRLKSPPEVRVMQQSFSEIVRRHEVLRTVFGQSEGRPHQIIRPAEPVPLPVIDLCALDDERRESQAKRLALEEALRPFDLATPPMLRTTLMRLGPSDHILLLSAHHIAWDGWSLRIFEKEFLQLYQAFGQGRPSPLAPLKFQYADYAAWQRGWLEEGVMEAQVAYWRKQLEGIPPFEIPSDRPLPERPSYRAGQQDLSLGPELSARLKEFSQQHGLTLFMTLLGGLQILLQRTSHQSDVVVGTTIANRRHSALEDLIGFFVNNLVLRIDLSGDPGVLECLQRVKQVTLQAYSHQDVPFERLVEELQPPRRPGRHPFFQILFLLQFAPPSSADGLSPVDVYSPFQFDSPTVAFDLILDLREKDGEVKGWMKYSRDLFEASTIREMLDRYSTLLQEMVSRPQDPISQLAIVSEKEEARLAAAFADDWDDLVG